MTKSKETFIKEVDGSKAKEHNYQIMRAITPSVITYRLRRFLCPIVGAILRVGEWINKRIFAG